MRIDVTGWDLQAVEAIKLAEASTMPLVQSGACTEAGKRLRRAGSDDLFGEAHSPQGVLAGLLLHLNCWREAHEIAQDLHTPDGSYWHAIVHRMEPSGWNSGYWFQQVGKHAIFPELQARAAELTARYPNARFNLGSVWDPAAFIEFCEEAATDARSDKYKLGVAIQEAEWELLMQWCARRSSSTE